MLLSGSSPTPTPSASAQPAAGTFRVTSSAFTAGGTLPMMYTADGAGVSPPLAWSGAPAGTKEFALTMTTQALDGEKWNWVLYGIPAAATSLAEGTSAGTAGAQHRRPRAAVLPAGFEGAGGEDLHVHPVCTLRGARVRSVPAAEVSGPVLG